MPASDNLTGLDPVFSQKITTVLSCLESKGWAPRVASGLRSAEEQAQKVAQGYSDITNSKHLGGRAADVIDRRYAWNIPKSHAFWQDLSTCAKAQGLNWGGDWTIKDVAHVELP